MNLVHTFLSCFALKSSTSWNLVVCFYCCAIMSCNWNRTLMWKPHKESHSPNSVCREVWRKMAPSTVNWTKAISGLWMLVIFLQELFPLKVRARRWCIFKWFRARSRAGDPALGLRYWCDTFFWLHLCVETFSYVCRESKIWFALFSLLLCLLALMLSLWQGVFWSLKENLDTSSPSQQTFCQ